MDTKTYFITSLTENVMFRIPFSHGPLVYRHKILQREGHPPKHPISFPGIKSDVSFPPIPLSSAVSRPDEFPTSSSRILNLKSFSRNPYKSKKANTFTPDAVVDSHSFKPPSI